MKISGSIFALFASFVVLLSLGCVMPPRNAVTIDVPFAAIDQTNHCGVAALAMALGYHGVPHDMARLSQSAYIPAMDGSTPELLATVAMDHGLNASLAEADPETLRRAIDARLVPIVYLTPTATSNVGHFVVISGVSFDGDKLLIHDAAHKSRWIRTRTLLERSDSGRFPTVLVGHPRTQ